VKGVALSKNKLQRFPILFTFLQMREIDYGRYMDLNTMLRVRTRVSQIFFIMIVSCASGSYLMGQCQAKPIGYTTLFDDPAMDFVMSDHSRSYQICGLMSNEVYEVSTAQSSISDSIDITLYDLRGEILSQVQAIGGPAQGQIFTTFRASDTQCITFQIDLPNDCITMVDIDIPFIIRRPAAKSPLIATVEVDADVLASQVFSNSCVDVSNATISGNNNGQAVGQFYHGGHIYQIEEGILLTTGDVDVAVGPNPPGNQGKGLDGDRAVDPDINQVNMACYNEAILEFDFTSSIEELTLSYSYASDEYCLSNDSNAPDPMLILLSGPGISGPFSNGAINLATLNDGTPISYNSINNIVNNEFYVSNSLQSEIDFRKCVTEPGRYLDDTGFDGFTTVFTAKSSIIPCETYHLKIAIADQRNGSHDSGVFVSANSMIAHVDAYADTYVNDQVGNVIKESCSQNPYLLLSAIDPAILGVSELDLNISSRSTASEGADYRIDQKVIKLLPGQNEYKIPITIIQDTVQETPELIVLELSIPCPCGDLNVVETAVFIIVDEGIQDCDDGDCANGIETWDDCSCQPGEILTDPGCDDGDCRNGVETWDGCRCIIQDLVKGCTDPEADNFDPNAVCDDGSCSYDSQALYYIPNSFSPNADGQNDFFSIFGPNIASSQYSIYDRWGNRVFRSSATDAQWDGNCQGRRVESGVYLVRYELSFEDGKTESGELSILLIR